MFLKVQGVAGEAGDAEHKGEIDVVSWSWGLQASASAGNSARETGTSYGELRIVKRVDQSSPTLMNYLRSHKLVKEAQLTVRKAGATPLEYFRIELENVRVTSLQAGAEGAELLEHVSLGFSKVRVTYIPQDERGGRGASNVFEADAHART
jgi:type VI secretion system secreted protein Hcp